jgi:hypothetical protein
MKKIKITLLFLTLINSVIFAQNKIIVVTNDAYSQQKLPFVNLILKNADRTIKTQQSNDKGILNMVNLIDGVYQLSASFIGYKNIDTTVNINALSYKTINLFLTPNLQTLQGVTVTASKPYLTMQKGNLVLNIAQSPLAKAGNIWEALRYAPTVQTQETGALTVKSQQTTVYLDGRRVYLAGVDLKQYLEGISASTISKIEIISTPSAIYPSDVQTVINIKSDNLKYEGVKGSINTAGIAATFPRYRLGTNLDIKKSIFDAQIGYAYTYTKVRNTTFIQLKNKNIYPWDVNQQADNEVKSNRLSLNLGIKPSKKSTFIIYGEVTPANTNSINSTNNGLPTPNRVLAADSIFKLNYSTAAKANSYFTQASYKTEWDSTKQNLNLQVEYFYNDKALENNRNVNNFKNNQFVTSQFQDILPQNLKTFVATANYNRPFVAGSLVVGGRYSQNNLNNNNATYAIDNFSGLKTITSASVFNFTENNYSSFVEWSKEKGKFYYRTGLRAESNIIKAKDKINNFDNTINWFTWFPSVLMQYAAGANNVWVISYKKTFTRPDYYQLNPFERFTDNSIANFKGNAAIKPQIDHTLDLSWTDNKTFNISIGGQINKNFIGVIILKDANGNFYQQFDNIDYKTVYASFNSSHDPFKFWKIVLSSGIQYFEGNYPKIATAKASPIIDFNFMQVFTLKNNWLIQVNNYVKNTFSDGFFEHKGYYNLSMAVQKRLTKPNLTCTLSALDIFRTQTEGDRILYQNLSYKTRAYNDMQLINLSLVWNFGKQNLQIIQKNISESDGNIKRLGTDK